jgi:hypothetical protein
MNYLRLMRGFLALLAATLLFMMTGIALQHGAYAQACPTMDLTFIFRDGKTMHVFYCGRWDGILGDRISGGGDIVDDMRRSMHEKQPSLLRSAVRFVCYGVKCPENLPATQAKEDIVVWKDGSRTTGRVEAQCELYYCRVYQNGKLASPDSKNYNYLPYTLSYIEFAEEVTR